MGPQHAFLDQGRRWRPGYYGSAGVEVLLQALVAIKQPPIRDAATPAVIRQIAWLFRIPPNGIVQHGNVHTEIFGLPGDPSARVDIENHSGHNLREFR